jgi:hypothetical protein
MSNLCGSSENIISVIKYTLNTTELDDPCLTLSTITTKTKECSAYDGDDKKTDGSPPPVGEKNDEGSDGNGGNDGATNNNDDKDKTDDKESSKDGGDKEEDESDDDVLAPVSDLSDVNRRIYVVTTASLPWRYVR